MSRVVHGVRLCVKCSSLVGLAKRVKKERMADKILPASVVHHKSLRAMQRAEREARLLAIRGALLDETGGFCAVCRCVIGIGDMEAHHIVSGGLRRHRERKETMVALCHGCHTGDGHNNPEVMAKLLAWCQRTGRQEAARELTRRLDKIERMRR